MTEKVQRVWQKLATLEWNFCRTLLGEVRCCSKTWKIPNPSCNCDCWADHNHADWLINAKTSLLHSSLLRTAIFSWVNSRNMLLIMNTQHEEEVHAVRINMSYILYFLRSSHFSGLLYKMLRLNVAKNPTLSTNKSVAFSSECYTFVPWKCRILGYI